MKKAFIGLLILLLCAFVQSAFGAAGDVASVGGKAVTAIATIDGKAGSGIATLCGKSYTDGDSALSCTTSDDSAILDKVSAGSTDNSAYACHKFTFATDFRITQYVIAGNVTSGTSGGIEISVYNHNGGTDLPSTQVSGTSIVLPYNETESTPFTVTIASPKDMSAGTYWVCSIATGDTVRTYDYYTSSGDRACYGAASCSSGAANTALSVRIMGCTP